MFLPREIVATSRIGASSMSIVRLTCFLTKVSLLKTYARWQITFECGHLRKALHMSQTTNSMRLLRASLKLKRIVFLGNSILDESVIILGLAGNFLQQCLVATTSC